MQKSEFKQSLLVKHSEDTTFAALEANNGAPRPQFLYVSSASRRPPAVRTTRT
jgi:hypothetical protein